MKNRKNAFRRSCTLILSTLLALGLTACSASEKEEPQPVIIHMYGSLDFPYLTFFNKMQETFPEITLEYEYQWDKAGFYEAERRMLYHDSPDIFVITGSALSSMTEKGYLLNLTREEFSSRYHVSTLSSLNENGQIYGLPLPEDLHCLICNRGMLKKYGINELPQTIPDLLEACHILTSEGQKGIIADEPLFSMILRTSWLYGLDGYEWITSYNLGETSMAGTPAADVWTQLSSLAEASGCSSEDSSALPARRTSLILEEEYAFRVSNISNLKYMIMARPELDLVALPYLGNTIEDQWVYYSPPSSMRFFAASAELEKPENAAKKEAVLGILDWISTPEIQKILASSGAASTSYVNGVNLDQKTLMEYLTPVIEKGHITNSIGYERGVGTVIASNISKLLSGEITPEDAVTACDMQNKSYVSPQETPGLDEVIGQAEETVYWRKPAAVTVGSPMSQLAAAAMAEAFPDADFSFAMAKNAAATLYRGDITLREVLECAKGEQDSELVLVQATGHKIKEVMEMGIGSLAEPNYIIPYGIAGAGRLLHPVGLTYEADVSRKAGDRITSITLDSGEDFNPEKTYTIAVSRLMVDVVTEPNFSDCEVTGTETYLSDVLTTYIQSHQTVSSPSIGFTISGAPAPLYELP